MRTCALSQSDASKGVMIAFKVESDDPHSHVTLFYFGKSNELSDNFKTHLVTQFMEFPVLKFEAEVVSNTHFPEGEDGVPCIDIVSSPLVDDVRTGIKGKLDYVGLDYRKDHGFIPHVTKGYHNLGECPLANEETADTVTLTGPYIYWENEMLSKSNQRSKNEISVPSDENGYGSGSEQTVHVPVGPQNGTASQGESGEGHSSRIVQGENLAEFLNKVIDSMDKDRSEIITAISKESGITTSTVGQILSGHIVCPPLERLKGIADSLSISLDAVKSAAEKDGCDYMTNKNLSMVSEGSWDGSASRFTDNEYKMSAALCREDGPPKTVCGLPHHEPSGEVSRAGVHAAAQRINQVKAPPELIKQAKAHLRGHYSKDLKEDPPEVLMAVEAPVAFLDVYKAYDYIESLNPSSLGMNDGSVISDVTRQSFIESLKSSSDPTSPILILNKDGYMVDSVKVQSGVKLGVKVLDCTKFGDSYGMTISLFDGAPFRIMSNKSHAPGESAAIVVDKGKKKNNDLIFSKVEYYGESRFVDTIDSATKKLTNHNLLVDGIIGAKKKFTIVQSDSTNRFTWGVMMAPYEIANGRYASNEVIRMAAWNYVLNHQGVGVMHEDGTEGMGVLVESSIERSPAWTHNDQEITTGCWTIGTLWSAEAWEWIENGTLTGYSIQGIGVDVPPEEALAASAAQGHTGTQMDIWIPGLFSM